MVGKEKVGCESNKAAGGFTMFGVEENNIIS